MSPPRRTSGAEARRGRAAASFPTRRRPRRSGGRPLDGSREDEGLGRDGEAADEGRVGVGSTFDGEPRDGGHCFEEAPDHVITFGDQRVAQPLQDERGEGDEIRLGGGDVGCEFIGDRIVVQLCDSPVARAYRRDNTQVVLEGQLRVEVVRFDEAVIVHLVHDVDGVVTIINNGFFVQEDETKV